MKGAFGGQLAASAPPRGGHAGPPGSLGEAVPEPRCTRAPGQRPVCGVAGPGSTVGAGPALEPVPGPERPPPAGPRSREAPRISRPGGRPAPEAAGGGRSTRSLTRPSAQCEADRPTRPAPASAPPLPEASAGGPGGHEQHGAACPCRKPLAMAPRPARLHRAGPRPVSTAGTWDGLVS